MSNTENTTLFTPLQIGPMRLKHRVVMAPLTRNRASQPDSVPGDLMREYYAQRASDGGLIIGEATNISVAGRGWAGSPGLYADEQVAGWTKIVDAVHAKGGFLFAQLWHTGRSANVETTDGTMPVTASVNPAYWNDDAHLVQTPSGWQKPSPHRALEVREIAGIVEDYGRAAERAMTAGFDGVELHAANGYLIDQFLEDGSNQRTDAYGGSMENRARFLMEVMEALVSVGGPGRVGVRVAPGGTWNAMSDSDPKALFRCVAEGLNRFDLAWIDVIEPRVKGNTTIDAEAEPVAAERLRAVYRGRILSAGGYEPANAERAVERGQADAVVFGRHFVANPDLPRRIALGLPLTEYDRTTFYTYGPKGYTDYAVAAAVAV